MSYTGLDFAKLWHVGFWIGGSAHFSVSKHQYFPFGSIFDDTVAAMMTGDTHPR